MKAVVSDELHVQSRDRRPARRDAEVVRLVKGVVQPAGVDLRDLLLQLLVDRRAQMIPHHDVDDRGRDRDGRRHCDRRGNREA